MGNAPRSRLDAGTMGTMGGGLGYAIAAALSDPKRPVLAVLGDSAFGFSGMECEVIARYGLKVIIVVLNNGGIYGGDRRSESTRAKVEQGMKVAGFGGDPAPTAFAPGSHYDMIMKAFSGEGYVVSEPEVLAQRLKRSLEDPKPALIDVTIDPMSGVESANMNKHNFISKL